MVTAREAAWLARSCCGKHAASGFFGAVANILGGNSAMVGAEQARSQDGFAVGAQRAVAHIDHVDVGLGVVERHGERVLVHGQVGG